MTDGNKISRRDWFRLRPRRTPSNGAESDDTVIDPNRTMGEVPDRLQAIAHPVNHDGMDLSELPPMREAILSEAQVRQLFADIESLASDILLMQRSTRSLRATTSRATASKATTAEQLRTAQNSLLSGNVPRVQIRYHWQEANWIDTLEARDDGVRLVRISHNKPTLSESAG
jgi:hypothetical protein